MKTAGVCALAIASALSLVACDKIKSLAGGKDGGDEGGTSSSGGGVLSFLGGDFEGSITMLMSGKEAKGPVTTVFEIKKPKYRIDLSAAQAAAAGAGAQNPMLSQGGALILDPPAKTGYLLINQQKMAVVIDFNKLKSMKVPGGVGGGPSGPSTPTEPSDPPKIEKTGKKETIAGYTCEDWKITTKTSHADACMAEGIKWFDISDLGVGGASQLALAGATDLNHFPLKVITYDANNAEESRMEAQKIEKKKIEDSQFSVPAGYKVVDMSTMLGGLMGGGAGGPGGLPPGFTPPAKKH